MTLPFDSTHPAPAASGRDIPDRPRVLTVSSLNRLARSLLEGNFPSVLVEGEISNFSTPASGHWYLTLKDEKSQLRCAMFRNSNLRVRFRPANGINVLVKGRLSLYEARGDYQLIIEDMEEAGDGALRRAFEKLKTKLAAEGLFEKEHKQILARGYRHIGVITSPSGAAIRDILTVFKRRFPATRITLLPVAVQGAEAAAEIIAAIERANRLARQLGIEVLLIGRGGGSLEDLQAFNEESVARAIHASQLPTVCGIGHEIDFTIADFTADLRAPTPSAAAELLSPDQREYRQSLSACLQQLTASISRRLKQNSQQINWLSRQLRHPGRRLQDHAQTLDHMDNRMKRALHWQLQQRRNSIRELRRSLLSNSPGQTLTGLIKTHASLRSRLLRAINNRQSVSRTALKQLVHNLNTVNPLNTLARGFSITYNESGEVLYSSDKAKKGDLVTTRLHKGNVKSKITEVHADSPSLK